MKKLIALVAGAMLIMPAMAADYVTTSTGTADIDVNVTIDEFFQVTVYGGLSIDLDLSYPLFYDAGHVTVGVIGNTPVTLGIATDGNGLFDADADLWEPVDSGVNADVHYGFTDGDGSNEAYTWGTYSWGPITPGSTELTKNIAVDFQGSLDIPAATPLDGKIVLTIS